jgi:argininosuccinate lyase
MPHKKNPDVFELIRSRCNQLLSLPNDITLMTANLPSGYHRDLQLLKELLFPAIQHLKDCLRMMQLMLSNISVKKSILSDERYKYVFSVEEVNKLVLGGMPFRDAYKHVGMSIENGSYKPGATVDHHHEGSIGNLNLAEVQDMFNRAVKSFEFETYRSSINKLVN